MYDYEFSYKTFDGERHLYMERFNKLLSDEEVSKELDKLFDRYDNVESAILNRVFEVQTLQ